MWTNTVCSHPRHVPDEIDNSDNNIGVRRAACRRSQFELNMDLDLSEVYCGARILYYAIADKKFAEYEMDYICFAKVPEIAFKANPDEISATQFVSQQELATFLQGKPITPWFKLILDSGMLQNWWSELNENGSFPDESH